MEMIALRADQEAVSEIEMDITVSVTTVLPDREVLVVPESQRYYWSKAWQLGEAATLAELGTGNAFCFEDPMEAIQWLLAAED